MAEQLQEVCWPRLDHATGSNWQRVSGNCGACQEGGGGVGMGAVGALGTADNVWVWLYLIGVHLVTVASGLEVLLPPLTWSGYE